MWSRVETCGYLRESSRLERDSRASLVIFVLEESEVYFRVHCVRESQQPFDCSSILSPVHRSEGEQILPDHYSNDRTEFINQPYPVGNKLLNSQLYLPQGDTS